MHYYKYYIRADRLLSTPRRAPAPRVRPWGWGCRCFPRRPLRRSAAQRHGSTPAPAGRACGRGHAAAATARGWSGRLAREIEGLPPPIRRSTRRSSCLITHATPYDGPTADSVVPRRRSSCRAHQRGLAPSHPSHRERGLTRLSVSRRTRASARRPRRGSSRASSLFTAEGAVRAHRHESGEDAFDSSRAAAPRPPSARAVASAASATGAETGAATNAATGAATALPPRRGS